MGDDLYGAHQYWDCKVNIGHALAGLDVVLTLLAARRGADKRVAPVPGRVVVVPRQLASEPRLGRHGRRS
jgi:hypothetical protein